MKKLKILSCIIICTMMFALIGCSDVVSETPIDTEYIAAYDAMETVYEYQWDWLHGDFKLMPVYKSVHHEEKFKVQYKIVYSNGDEYTEWRTVDKQTYEEALREMENGT